MKNKLENIPVLITISKNDVIWITELKSNLDIHLPGYKSFRNPDRYQWRHLSFCQKLRHKKNEFLQG